MDQRLRSTALIELPRLLEMLAEDRNSAAAAGAYKVHPREESRYQLPGYRLSFEFRTNEHGEPGLTMVDDRELNAWFVREVLPLERALTAYIRRNWRVPEDVLELRQDIYENALVGARRGLPRNARAFVYVVARNHLINNAKRARIVPIETMADLDLVDRDIDMFEADRALTARDELRRAKEGIDKLPPKCREIVILQKVEGLTDREAAEILGVSVETVRRQIKLGMKALIDHMLGGSGRIVRRSYRQRSRHEARP